MIKIVITDIEGILTPPEGSQSPWPLESLLRIRQFIHEQKQNIVCILCSGRSLSYGEAVIQALDLFFLFPKEKAMNTIDIWKTELITWPSILENGTCFYDPLAKRIIVNPELSETQLEHLNLIKEKVIPILIKNTGCQLESGKMFSISLNPPFRKGSDKKRISTEEFRPVVEKAMQDFLNYIEITHSISAVDITPQGISKASAVRFLIKNTNSMAEEILGVGDTAADEEWLNIVGWSAAPANGRGKIKKADYFSPYDVSEGFWDILNNLKKHRYEKVGR